MTTLTHHAGFAKEQPVVVGAVVLAHALALGVLWWMSLSRPAPPPAEDAIVLEMPGDGGPAGAAAAMADAQSAAPASASASAPQSATPAVQTPLSPIRSPQAAEQQAPVLPPAPEPATSMAQTSAPAANAKPMGNANAAAGTTGTAAGAASPSVAAQGHGSGAQQGDGHGGGTRGDGGAGWRHRVLAHLERAKRYPELARLMKREGMVQVSFAMNRRGEVLAVAVAKGSGMRALDDEAMEVVRRSQPLPPPPGDVGGERIEVLVPIHFTLQNAR